MSLVQDPSVASSADDSIASTTPASTETRPDVRKRITDISLTALVLAGIAALTLGWSVLLVRGAIWLLSG
jgi:hypothetical protein